MYVVSAIFITIDQMSSPPPRSDAHMHPIRPQQNAHTLSMVDICDNGDTNLDGFCEYVDELVEIPFIRSFRQGGESPPPYRGGECGRHKDVRLVENPMEDSDNVTDRTANTPPNRLKEDVPVMAWETIVRIIATSY